jgi:UMF1 family MFS transporter
LLATVSNEGNRGKVSGVGVAVGYVGSLIGLGIGRLTFDVLDWGYSGTFAALALAFLVFALPVFLLIHEPRSERGIAPPLPSLLKTWRDAAGHPGLVRFLVSRFLYTDAINTLIGGFLTIFVLTELDLARDQVDILLASTILAAILGGLAAGRLVGRIGSLAALRLVLVVWMLAIGLAVLAAATERTALIWLTGGLGGAALGGTWTADRVLMVQLSPRDRLGEFYGLYATVGRFASILGPLTWALVVDVLGWGRRAAMGALALFILLGWLNLRRVTGAASSSPSLGELSSG